MITKEELLDGLISYADEEVLPNLPTPKQWWLGAGIILLSEKGMKLIDTMSENPLIKSMDVIDCDGNIDSDLLIKALSTSARKSGKASFQIPLVGTLSFSANDVESLGRYLRGGLR